MIGESTGTGAALRTYVLRDDTPVAQNAVTFLPAGKILIVKY